MGRAGSDLALETTDAVIVRDELATVPTVLALSRQLVVQSLAIGAATLRAALEHLDALPDRVARCDPNCRLATIMYAP